MEVTRADASDIRPGFHADVRNLGVYLQAFHPENHFDACILHLLRPVDVGSLVKAGQQFDDHGHLLTVAGCSDKRFYHLRFLGQTVECDFDARNLFAHSCFLQHPDKRVEAMVRHVDETVFLLDFFQQAFRTVEFFFQDRRPFRIFQVAVSTIREFHQILVVLIASAFNHRIQAVEVELFQHPFQQVLRHVIIVNHTERFASFAALYPFGDFLKGTRAQVVVDFHFRIAGKLEGISFKLVVTQSFENQRKAAADDIVQIHQVTLVLMVGQLYETAADVDREFQKGIVRRGFAATFAHLHS